MTTPLWTGPLASIGQRAAARVIDTVIIWVPLIVAWKALDLHRWAALISGGMVTAAYEIGFLSTRGQTIGKKAMGVRVIAADGHPPRPEQAAKRWALPWGVGLVPFIGALLSLAVVLRAVAAPDRRGMHDIVADTWVVADHGGPDVS